MRILTAIFIALTAAGCSFRETTELYANGKVRAKGRHVVIADEDGQEVHVQHGCWITWHRNGTKASKVTFDEGKIIGESTYWHDNGILSGIDHHDPNGLAHGLSKRWSRSGKLLKDFAFVKGKGTQYYFCPDGELKAVIPFEKNLAEGTGIHYNKDGSVKKRIVYSKGKKVEEIKQNKGDSVKHNQTNERVEVGAQLANGSFHGSWLSDGELCYVINHAKGEIPRIKTPPNETWQTVIKNVRLVNGSLLFDQYLYTKPEEGMKTITNPSGEHPFSGVRCETEIKADQIDPNKLTISVKTVDTPEPIKDHLVRKNTQKKDVHDAADAGHDK